MKNEVKKKMMMR